MTAVSPTARRIASDVAGGVVSAETVVAQALSRIEQYDPSLNCFTFINKSGAMEAARALDAKIASGASAGSLAGVPVATKDLFDIAGETTLAGSKVRADEPPATEDAEIVAKLRAADAICIGRLNMDEFAYGFATVNAHFGATRNPHDARRLAGGSSGGSAAAVAAGMIPLTLGSDTNGSIRVPASLCGVYGLRPTYDVLPSAGMFPFVERLDTAGPLARSIDDLKHAFAVMAGRSIAPTRATTRPKIARLTGWFSRNCDPDGIAGTRAIAAHFASDAEIDLKRAEAARSAAFLITARAGGELHRETLATQAMAYDSAVRDRLIAGLALPEDALARANEVADQFCDELHSALARYDVLIAPCTPTPAPKISDGLINMNGIQVSARANLGILTQPLSLAGVPVLSAPLKRPGRLPLGVQLIAKPHGEDQLFAVAEALETAGLVGCDTPALAKAEL